MANNLYQALDEVGKLVAESAKQNLTTNGNVDTGALRDSITYRVEGNSVIIGTTIPYAPYIEMGTGLFAFHGDGRKEVPWHYKDRNGNWHTTSGIHPHPYLEPALFQNREAIVRLIKNAVLEGLPYHERYK